MKERLQSANLPHFPSRPLTLPSQGQALSGIEIFRPQNAKPVTSSSVASFTHKLFLPFFLLSFLFFFIPQMPPLEDLGMGLSDTLVAPPARRPSEPDESTTRCSSVALELDTKTRSLRSNGPPIQHIFLAAPRLQSRLERSGSQSPPRQPSPPPPPSDNCAECSETGPS